MKHNLGWNTRVIRFLFVVVALGLFSACARLPREMPASNQQTDVSATVSATASDTKQININAASATELERLPGVGKVLAARIVVHRENFGPFRRAEHLIVVRGISDKKFRALRNLIRAD